VVGLVTGIIGASLGTGRGAGGEPESVE
jgi:hypothetical protein